MGQRSGNHQTRLAIAPKLICLVWTTTYLHSVISGSFLFQVLRNEGNRGDNYIIIRTHLCVLNTSFLIEATFQCSPALRFVCVESFRYLASVAVIAD